MVAVAGTYQDGNFKLDREISFDKPVKVIITFLEDTETPSENRLRLSDFSFFESKKMLKDYSGSFSDTLIEERRSEL
jgi:hypothetical protein